MARATINTHRDSNNDFFRNSSNARATILINKSRICFRKLTTLYGVCNVRIDVREYLRELINGNMLVKD